MSRIPCKLTIGDSNIKLDDPLMIVNGFASQFSSVFNTNRVVGSSTNINNISCGSVICDNGNCDNVHSHANSICDIFCDSYTSNIPVLHTFSIVDKDIL